MAWYNTDGSVSNFNPTAPDAINDYDQETGELKILRDGGYNAPSMAPDGSGYIVGTDPNSQPTYVNQPYSGVRYVDGIGWIASPQSYLGAQSTANDLAKQAYQQHNASGIGALNLEATGPLIVGGIGAGAIAGAGGALGGAAEGGAGGFGGGGGGGSVFDRAFDFVNSYDSGGFDWGQALGTGENTMGYSLGDMGANFGTSGTGLANSITGTSLGGDMATSYSGALAGAGGSSPSFWGDIGKYLTQQLPGSGNGGLLNTAASGLLNYFMKQQQQGALDQAANKSAQLNDPMQQPQRAPFQAAYANLMFNPQSYHQTPYALGQIDLANQAFQANVSKYGPGGTQFSDYLRNVQNVNSQDYFKLADQFQIAGGFNQGTGGAGSAYANLAGQAANAGLGSYEGFGNLFANQRPQATNIPSGFDFSKTYTPQDNPFGGSTTYSM